MRIRRSFLFTFSHTYWHSWYGRRDDARCSTQRRTDTHSVRKRFCVRNKPRSASWRTPKISAHAGETWENRRPRNRVSPARWLRDYRKTRRGETRPSTGTIIQKHVRILTA